MRKTIHLHIGHYKTGTTALQVFLTRNRKKLLRRGIDYAEAMLSHAKHSDLAFSLYAAAGTETLMHGYDNPTPPGQVWAEIFDYAAASKAPAVLVSSEEFMRLGAHPRAVEILAGIIAAETRFDIRVIAYLRPPGSHLRSWYNQLVKMKSAPPDFNTAVCTAMEPVHHDYGLALKPWIDIFGAGAVTLRPYRSGLRHDNGLYRDFLAQLGVNFDRWPRISDWILPEEEINPRLDERLLELTRAMQRAGLGQPLQKWIVARAIEILPEEGPGADAAAFADIAGRAGVGLRALEALPGNGVDLAEFAADVPQPDPPWRAELTNLLALVLREEALLRDRTLGRYRELTGKMAAAEARIEALERRAGGGGGGLDDDDRGAR